MVRVLEAENVAHDFDDRVLKASSRGDERHTALPRKADRLQRPGHASIRARGGNEHAGVRLESYRRATLFDIDGRNPLELDARMTEPGVGCRVGVVGRVVVADDGSALTGHGTI